MSPAMTHQQDGSQGYEPSSVTGHEPIIVTISTGGAKVHNPKHIHSQVDSAHGSKKRSSSSESGHETSVVDSRKKNKKKKHKERSAGKSPAPSFISFSMCQPLSSMVKDYSWMLTDAADGTISDQSNPKVIIVDEPQEDDEVSQQDRVPRNPFTGPGDVVAGPHGHSNAPPPSQPGDRDDGSGKDGGFCDLVQSLEGMIPISEITEDNDPHSEILSNDSFAKPEGGYLASYIPENFEGLFLSKRGAPGILTCGYFRTSLRGHPLHCWGHSYTEGSEKVWMYPTRLGLVETGVGYTETVHIVRRGKEKFCTAVRKYNDLFMQSGYQAAAVDTWGGLHFLPLTMTVFLSCHKKNSFVNQLDSSMFGFDRCKGMTLFDDQTDVKSVASTDPYQAYVIAPIVKSRFWYVGVGLVFKPATIGAGHIAKCKMFLDSFFSLCGDLPSVEPREVYLLKKHQGVGPLSRPCPTWTCLDLLTPNPGI